MPFESILETVKIIGAISGIFAAVWVVFLYFRQRKGIWKIETNLTSQILPYSEDLSLLVIDVFLKNIGVTAIVPGVKGCQISIREIPEHLTTQGIVDSSNGALVLKDYNLLEPFRNPKTKDYSDDYYVIEPKCTYHEQCLVAVKKQRTYVVEMCFYYKNNWDDFRDSYCARVP